MQFCNSHKRSSFGGIAPALRGGAMSVGGIAARIQGRDPRASTLLASVSS
jgi:hypothetical protein